MNNWQSYNEATASNRISKAEQLDGIIYRIEQETDYDVLNHSTHSLDVIFRNGNDDEVVTVDIYGKSTDEIIEFINNL